jgi:hypothetical protein
MDPLRKKLFVNVTLQFRTAIASHINGWNSEPLLRCP